MPSFGLHRVLSLVLFLPLWAACSSREADAVSSASPRAGNGGAGGQASGGGGAGGGQAGAIACKVTSDCPEGLCKGGNCSPYGVCVGIEKVGQPCFQGSCGTTLGCGTLENKGICMNFGSCTGDAYAPCCGSGEACGVVTKGGVYSGLGPVCCIANVDVFPGYKCEFPRLVLPPGGLDFSKAYQCFRDSECPSPWGLRRCTAEKGAATPGICVSCVVDKDCGSAEQPRCGPDHQCHQCALTSEKQDCPDASKSRCGSGGVCVQCVSKADCGGAMPFCSSGSTCVGCLGDGDCKVAGKLHCYGGTCSQCSSDSHCATPTPKCSGGTCAM